ncbi:MAG: hypothetical protein PHC65_07490 [Methanobacteriaceae archaeon]|nr:hypothetical protein [Methanobacteriaceae archaeon]
MNSDDSKTTPVAQTSSINDLISVLNSVDVNSEEAKANKTSGKTDDGKRIELEDD